MKILMITILFAATSSVIAADFGAHSNAGRRVADDVEMVTLPGGEVVPRLVSRSGITARQFWVDSVYGDQESILVFPGKGGVTQAANAEPSGERHQQGITRNGRAPNERRDLATQTLDCR